MAKDSELVVLLKLDGTELGKSITKAQQDIGKIGVAFTAVSASAAVAVKFAANFQDSMIKAARSAGVTSAAFSSLSYAAGLSGVNTETLTKSLVKLQNPSKTASETFEDLGIKARDSSGKMKDQSKLLEELAGKFEGIQDPAIKSQAAVRLFGEEGIKMVSMLEGGAKALADARKEAEEFGQVVSEKAGKNAELFNDNLSKITMGMSGFRNVVSETIIETINQSKAFEKAQDVIKNTIKWWRDLSQEKKDLIVRVAAVTAAMGALALAVSAVAAAVPALAAGFAIITGPIGLATAAIVSFVTEATSFANSFESMTAKVLAFSYALSPIGNQIVSIINQFKSLRNMINGTTETAKDYGKGLDDATKKTEKKQGATVKLRQAVQQIDESWKYATKSLDGFQATMGEFVAASAPDMLSAEIEFREFSQGVEKAMQRSRKAIATANLAKELADIAGAAVKPFGELTDTIAKGIEYDSQVALRDLDVVSRQAEESYKATREALESSENEKIRALENSYDQQIRLIQDAENRKNGMAQAAANERLLIADEEYQKAKEAAQKAYEEQLLLDQENYESKMVILEERALDREQRQLTESIMEDDQRKLKELREKEHEERLAALAKEYADKTKGIDAEAKAVEKANTELSKLEIEALTKAKNEALTLAESEKNAKLKTLDEQRAVEEKDIEKKRLQTQYNAQVDAFNATKAVKIAETAASGAAAAAQAFVSMTAAMPFGLGQILGGVVAGVILTTTAMRIGQINSQKPIKPAGLLEDGGFIGGSGRHMDGSDYPARVESKEFVIDRGRTQKMFNAIDSGIMGGGVTIRFEAGAIQGDIRDERTIDRIADMLGRKISRQMVMS